jgi:hypothetical protein
MKILQSQEGKLGYAVAWLLGIPIQFFCWSSYSAAVTEAEPAMYF